MGVEISQIPDECTSLPPLAKMEISKLMSTSPDVWHTEFITGATIASEVISQVDLQTVLASNPVMLDSQVIISESAETSISLANGFLLNYAALGGETSSLQGNLTYLSLLWDNNLGNSFALNSVAANVNISHTNKIKLSAPIIEIPDASTIQNVTGNSILAFKNGSDAAGYLKNAADTINVGWYLGTAYSSIANGDGIVIGEDLSLSGRGMGVNNAALLLKHDTQMTLEAPTILVGSGSNLLLDHDATASLEAVTYQQLQAWQVGLWDDRGTFDASVNAYPSSGGSGSAGAILKGDVWTISVAGTLPTGQVVNISDTVRALINTPGNAQSNWAIAEGNLGYTPLSNVLNSTLIFVGSAGNVATGVTMSGDMTINNTGVVAIGNDKVTVAMIADAELKALAGLTIAVDSLTIGTGAASFSQTTFAANTFPAKASTGNLLAKTITDFGLSIVAAANDASARLIIGNGIIFSSNTPTSVGATTNETLLFTSSLISTISVGDVLEFLHGFIGNNNANFKHVRLYISANATFGSGGGEILLTTGSETTVTNRMKARLINVLSNTTMRFCVPATMNINSDYAGGSANADTTITVPPLSAGIYFLITGQKPTATTDTVTVDRFWIRQSR